MVEKFTKECYLHFNKGKVSDDCLKIARIESFKFDYYYFDPKRHELIEVQNNNAYVYLFTDGWYFYDVNGNKHKYNRLQISDACERLCNKEESQTSPKHRYNANASLNKNGEIVITGKLDKNGSTKPTTLQFLSWAAVSNSCFVEH